MARRIIMQVSDTTVQELRDEIKAHIPDLKIVYKDEEGWHKTNSWTFAVWLFFELVGVFSSKMKKKFYGGYSNGLHGDTLVFPTRKGYEDWARDSVYRIVRHEYIHLRDQQQHPIWFPLSYIAVLPVVLTMRAYWEIRGYTATMLSYHELYGRIPEFVVERIAEQFTGSMYFWMCPFPQLIRDKLYTIREKIYMGEIQGLFF